jgi:archaetidylinositol phosphate synthase
MNMASTTTTATLPRNTDTTAATHTRDNRGLLARVEQRTLIWMAHRLPAWVHSDHLSGLGLIGMLAVGAAFAIGGTYPAALPVVVLALAVNWFGDSLDGTLARVRDQQRPRYGYYVDHALDIAGTTFLFGGLALGGLMTPAMAMGLMAAYFAVMAEVFLATSSRGVFRMSFLGFGPTELRVVLSLGALSLMRDPHVVIAGFGPYLLFDVGGVVAIAGLGMTFVASSIGNGRALYEAEPLERRAR